MELSLGISNQIKFGFLKFADPPLYVYAPNSTGKNVLSSAQDFFSSSQILLIFEEKKSSK